MTLLTFALLTISGLAFAFRALRGPSVVDRILAVDGLITVAIGAVAVDAFRRSDARFVDATILLGIIAFVGTAIAARFIERRGA